MARRMNWDKAKIASLRHQEIIETRAEAIPSTRRPPIKGNEGLRKYGRCPRCSGYSWWDNQIRKQLGGMQTSAPDAECTFCHFKIWPTAPQIGATAS